MATDMGVFLHRWFDEVWNQGREEKIDELLAADGVAYGLGESDADVHGPAGFKVFWRNLRSALPDLHITVEDAIIQGDKAAARLTLTGRHTGDGIGVAPTGRAVRVRGIVMIQVANGQIVNGWNSWDQLGLLQQLGSVPGERNADRFLATG